MLVTARVLTTPLWGMPYRNLEIKMFIVRFIIHGSVLICHIFLTTLCQFYAMLEPVRQPQLIYGWHNFKFHEIEIFEAIQVTDVELT